MPAQGGNPLYIAFADGTNPQRATDKETSMLIGVPKEIKDNEYRVGLVPSTVRELADKGHQVLVETGAGLGRGPARRRLQAAGAEIVHGCRRSLQPRRTDREGQGAARGRAQEAAPRAGAVHLSASRARSRADRGADGIGRHRHRLRDGDEPAGHAAAADADVGGRRPHGAACRRALPGKGERRPRRAARRRAGRVGRRASSCSAAASPAPMRR